MKMSYGRSPVLVLTRALSRLSVLRWGPERYWNWTIWSTERRYDWRDRLLVGLL